MEVVIVLGGPNTKENIKELLENRYGKAYEDFRFVGVDGGALRLLDQHRVLLSRSLLKKTILILRQPCYG